MNHRGLWNPGVWPHSPHDSWSGVDTLWVSFALEGRSRRAFHPAVLCVSIWHFNLPGLPCEARPSVGRGSFLRPRAAEPRSAGDAAEFARPLMDGHADLLASTCNPSLAMSAVHLRGVRHCRQGELYFRTAQSAGQRLPCVPEPSTEMAKGAKTP